MFSDNPTYNKADPDSEEDSVSLEKAEAQKAVSVLTVLLSQLNILIFGIYS